MRKLIWLIRLCYSGIQRMIPGGSTDTDKMTVDWGDGTSTMLIGPGLNPLFVHTYNVPFTDNYTLISED
mgnify:CR=1 FL=1